MSMRVREKTHKKLYPHWSHQDSPARQCKARDGFKCVVCGIEDRTLILDEAGNPHHILYLHAAHISYLDPMFAEIEPLDGEVLRAMCPHCHRKYDTHWKPMEEEVEHQRRLHSILLSRWLPDAWLAKRFLEVV